MSLNYTVRESPRAKHVSLRILPSGALEVIVPQGFDSNRVAAIVQRKQRWIERTMQRVTTQQASTDSTSNELPKRVFLSAIQEEWKIEYCPTQWLGVKATVKSDSRLVLSGHIADAHSCKAALQLWVIHQARLHLIPQLRTVSQELGLRFQSATVRQQKTLWGSCSQRKTISLNCKLLFLPGPLVRYVFVHELCHTIHLNHSPQFWALVGRYEPNYKQLDARLREVRHHVPWWMER